MEVYAVVIPAREVGAIAGGCGIVLILTHAEQKNIIISALAVCVEKNMEEEDIHIGAVMQYPM